MAKDIIDSNHIPITHQMADAINTFTGTTIIEEEEIGKPFYQGKKGNGMIGIETQTSFEECGCNRKKIFHLTGNISKLHSQNEVPTCDNDWNPTHLNVPHWKQIPPRTAIIIIGALYGFGEVGKNFKATIHDKEMAIALRKNMGLPNLRS